MNNLSLRKLLVRGAGVLFLLASACNGTPPSNMNSRGNPDAGADGKRDGATEVACLAAAAPRKTLGAVCGCDSDCDSGFCVDGVCCASACQDTCKACNVPGMMGSCTFVPAGVKPRNPDTCKKSDVGTCGLDGTCNGSGTCRDYPTGTICTAGTCDQASVTNINVCNGTGRCVPGSLKICVPYNCNQAQKDCASACTTNADCSTGHACVGGSCGPKPPGAPCKADAECELGHCFDGVCCESACNGACVSCALVGHEGTCWPIAAGVADPRNVCKDSGPASCGQTGSCDGEGSCDLYSRGTVCSAPICSGDRLLTAATCDGNGTCGQPDVNDCPPYRCINGACKAPCAQDSDCVAGHACVNMSCGPRQLGQPCAASAECASNFCVDGVCCENSCQGACRSCALASSKGRCTNLAANALDTRNVCKDQGQNSCGTNGKCNGGGGCQKYGKGAQCAGESCGNNVYSPPSTCDGNGACIFPGTRSCAPFACNGSKCFDRCTTDGNCAMPNICVGNSCGKGGGGAACSNNAACISNICAQGVCCSTPCDGFCKSCALANSRGTCTNLPPGSPDTTNTCATAAATTCGTNGKCEGGGCQKYAAGTACKPPSCAAGSTTLVPGAACDGAGNCVTPASMSCIPYKCGTAVCKATCTADADCSAGNVCTKGSCGLKPPGAQCSGGMECASGNCIQGVCCNTACNTACNTCILQGNVGTCRPLATNTPDGRCPDSGAASCGTDGLCDGNGGCQKYAGGTVCAPASCAKGGSTLTQAKACDGKGNCVAPNPATVPCAPFLCTGGTTCPRNCGTNADCTTGVLCVNNVCGGKKGAGDMCMVSGECASGFCVDGTCCRTNTCPTCQACNISNDGTCANIPAKTKDGRCSTANQPACGQTGTCDGTGKCANVASGTSCGDACSPGMCDGAGVCANPMPVNCDDSNPCTVDSCAGNGMCSHTPVMDGMACSDGNTCNGAEICQGGMCKAGTPLNCDDGNPCTTDGCTSGTGCTHMPVANNTTCPANGCSASASCQMGQCVQGPGKNCDDKNPCTADSCDMSGNCVHTPVANGTDCSDGNACNGAETCQGGTCANGTAPNCDDNNPCTTDTCAPATGCANTAVSNGTSCSDGNACNGAETCQAGSCIPGMPVSCMPPDQCHMAGICNSTTGACSMGAVKTGPCDDGKNCTTGDVCDANGTCAGTPVTCPNPIDPCHVAGTCTEATGMCSAQGNAPNNTPCDDSNACTQTDKCQNGTCMGTNPVQCSGASACTDAGTCNPANGICTGGAPKPNGTGCDDGNKCTTGDACDGNGNCSGTPKVCTASDQCHTPGTCDPSGTCSNPAAMDGTGCDDGKKCTTGDICTGGVCGGTPMTCPDPMMCNEGTGMCQ